MTASAYVKTKAVFQAAFERVADFAQAYRLRRARRIALATLMDMDARRLDDLGLNVQDVIDAFHAQSSPAEVLDARRAECATWSPARSLPAAPRSAQQVHV